MCNILEYNKYSQYTIKKNRFVLIVKYKMIFIKQRDLNDCEKALVESISIKCIYICKIDIG